MQQGFKDGNMAEGVKETYQKYKDTFDFKLRSHQVSENAFKLCLIDVNSGSDTKLMVKKVLDWAKTRQANENDMFSNELCSSLY
jgi:hypothetical protein